jgi:hypothetical protein
MPRAENANKFGWLRPIDVSLPSAPGCAVDESFLKGAADGTLNSDGNWTGNMEQVDAPRLVPHCSVGRRDVDRICLPSFGSTWCLDRHTEAGTGSRSSRTPKDFGEQSLYAKRTIGSSHQLEMARPHVGGSRSPVISRWLVGQYRWKLCSTVARGMDRPRHALTWSGMIAKHQGDQTRTRCNRLQPPWRQSPLLRLKPDRDRVYATRVPQADSLELAGFSSKSSSFYFSDISKRSSELPRLVLNRELWPSKHD